MIGPRRYKQLKERWNREPWGSKIQNKVNFAMLHMMRRASQNPIEPHLLNGLDVSKTDQTRNDILELLKPIEQDIYDLTDQEQTDMEGYFLGAAMKYKTK